MKLPNAIAGAVFFWCAAVAHSAPITNEALFDQCRVAQTIGNGDGSTESQRFQGVQCMAYLGGAVQVYAFTNLSCKMDSKTIKDVIVDYLTYTRKSGGMDQPAAVVVHSLFDDCYCNTRQTPAFQAVCPPPLPPR